MSALETSFKVLVTVIITWQNSNLIGQEGVIILDIGTQHNILAST